MNSQHEAEIKSGNRFAFGANWSRFLREVNDRRIGLAEESLLEMLEAETLDGKSFLDVGSGSGLFSLAARRLGAKVHSFDYDPQSVACTTELKRRYHPNDPGWTIEQGSVLDLTYLQTLTPRDIVYSWGVLHHTGAMWRALENAATLVKPGGQLFIALYNQQGRRSRVWLRIKQAYNRTPSALRWLILWPVFFRLWAPPVFRDLLLKGRPLHTWRRYGEVSLRGMSPWRDAVDWVGGLPFEVAKPEEVLDFCRQRGFVLKELRTCEGRHGCNEFVFESRAPQ